MNASNIPWQLKAVKGINYFRLLYPFFLLVIICFIYFGHWGEGTTLRTIQDDARMHDASISYNIGQAVGRSIIPFLLIGLQIYFIRKKYFSVLIIVIVVDMLLVTSRFYFPLLPLVNLILVCLPKSRRFLNGKEDLELLDEGLLDDMIINE